MAVKIHGSPFSTATMRVLAAAYEKELDFEFVLVDMASGAHKQQPFLSLNPFGQVPVLEVGDFTLFESRAITKYIAYTQQTKGTQLLLTEGAHQMATQTMWAEVEAHQYDALVTKLVWELFFKTAMFHMEPDKAAVEENEAKLAKVLDIYETQLAKSKYVAGETFTLVDLHHLPSVHYLMGTQVKTLFEERTHVHAWVKDILARPAWAKVVAMQKN